MHTHAILVIFFRWLHVTTACLVIGGTFLIRMLVPRALSVLPEEQRTQVFLRLRRGFKRLIHTSILFLVVSGICNSVWNWPAYHRIPGLAQPFWGTHVLLALGVFAILLKVLAGREAAPKQRGWMTINLILMAMLLAAAAGLKYVRDNHPRNSTNNSTSTDAPSGSALTPTAARAWRPDSPSTS
jgi:uncharacterized membrane protein